MARLRQRDKTRQLLAIIKKNFVLQTRGRRSLLGIGGWAGLILQLLLPVSFFLVMYLPKHYIQPIHHGETPGWPPVRLESRSWAEPYDGPATFPSHGGRAALLLTPDSPEVRGLALVLSRTLACPRDPRMRLCPSANMPASFHCMFMPPPSPSPPGGTVAFSSMYDGGTRGGGGANGANGASGAAAAAAAAATRDATAWLGEQQGQQQQQCEQDKERVWDSSGGSGLLLQRWWARRQLSTGDNGGDVAVGGEAAAGQAAAASLDPTAAADPCADFATCVTTPSCYEHVLRNQITFMASQEVARHATVSADQQWDAIVHFPKAAAAAGAAATAAENDDEPIDRRRDDRGGAVASVFVDDNGDGVAATTTAAPMVSELLSFVSIGMNHSDVPPTKFLLDLFEVVPTRGNGLALYRRYWFFSNLQLAVNRAILGIHIAQSSPPPSPSASPPPSPSPWPPSPSPLASPPPAPPMAPPPAASPPPATLDDHPVSRSSQRRTLYDEQTARQPYEHPPSLENEDESTGAAARALREDQPAFAAASPYDNAVPANVEVSYKAFPWPAVTEDLGAAGAAVFFQLLLVYAFLPPTRAVVGDIVREKELRLREGMRVLGLSEPSYWMSWGLTHWLLLALSGALCTAAGTYPFTNSSASIMLAFYWLYGAALVSYAYCLSTMFSSSRVAGTVVQLLYAISMLPGFVLPAVYQYGSWTWYAACLAPPSAATLWAAALINWEKVAEGITPATLRTPITQANGFCAATVLWILALDVVLYGMLTWYLDKVMPKSYGQRLPWWFVFDRRYWQRLDGSRSGSGGLGGAWRRLRRQLRGLACKGRRSSGYDGGSGCGRGLSLSGPLLGHHRDGGDAVLAVPVDQSVCAAAAAVEVRGLVKVFRTLAGENKVAVDHLDLQIERGCITALLGHNGAGKTTTIHILTGMLQPTAGSATVNGFDVATQMDRVRASLGICPQFDILWPDLTVYEHLELYGAIKGYLRDELSEVAAAAAASVGLTPKLHCAAGELSGGQRRKLSVAIAFMGDPAVVFLDEPTSGMDPYSRRFTWEVIRRHRPEAAIVLTTHSMEEADLLGDRVAILARGRLAAQGTGMELKANYGVGYNLTLVLDPRLQHQPSPSRQPPPPPPPSPPPPPQAPLRLQQQQQQQQPLLPLQPEFADEVMLQPQQPEQGAGRASVGSETRNPKPASSPRSSPSSPAAAAAAAAAAASSPSSPEAAAVTAVMSVVRRYVPAADLLSAAGAEMVVRLPREAAAAFPGLLRELEGPAGRQQLGVASYGLSLTTLEEVFLSITAAAEEQQHADDPGTAAAATATNSSDGGAAAAFAHTTPAAAPPPPLHPAPLTGWRLYGSQLRALFAKRALSARRDRLAVLTQLAVPLALVYLALWISSLQVREPSEPPLELSRRTALFARPVAWSASPAARNATEGCSGGSGGGSGGASGGVSGVGNRLAAFLAGHPTGGAAAIDSGATALFNGDPRLKDPRLEDYLLRRWYGGGGPVYDALHVTDLPPPAALIAAAMWPPLTAAAPPPPALSFVLLTNQSAVSALPAALADAMTAAWSYIGGGLPPPPPPETTLAAAEPLYHVSGGGAGGAQLLNPAAAAASFSAVSWPLPTLASEPVARIQRDAASLMLVLCLVLASSVLSASFVVFLVREQDNNSKHLQLVSGAPATAYWAANFGWDLISYSLSAAGLLALILSYRLPQYSGRRLAAVAGLLAGFGPSGISLTYMLHFVFRDEMRALQRLNTAYFLTGYLGFLATWICDLIEVLVVRSRSLHTWNRTAKWALRTASPHYCFARGMYDVQATYDSGLFPFPFGKRAQPFDWDVFGSPMAHMAVQTLVYGSLAVLYDAGMLTVAYAYGQDAVRSVMRWWWSDRGGSTRGGQQQPQQQQQQQQRRLKQGGGSGWRWWWRRRPDGSGGGSDGAEARLLALEEGVPLAAATALPEQVDGGMYGICDGRASHGGGSGGGGDGGSEPEEGMEDEDVAAEKRAVIEGQRDSCQVLLDGAWKSYSQGFFRPAIAAVRGLWVGVPAGECFGLLGVNGAGKTTTFRMLTGEVMPDKGDVRVVGHSVRTQLGAARRQLGYCPQFEALPGAMTGREVTSMYARLRGVPEPYIRDLVSYLLRRLGLEKAADSPCGGYSGGMKRKLGVAVALVGNPRVAALDEPSTGMDPGARRGLWSCLQSEVIRAGRTVVLTSHSMEECEALCTRLTIMVAGRLRCLGTVQHLKSRFGGGYLLEIKTQPRSASSPSLVAAAAAAGAVALEPPPGRPLELRSTVTATGATGAAAAGGPAEAAAAAVDAAALTEWVASVCPGAVLSRVDQNRFTFAIPRNAVRSDADTGTIATADIGSETATGNGARTAAPALDLAALFEAVESQRSVLGLLDYCLTQTTLEQLFVSLAGATAPGDGGGGGGSGGGGGGMAAGGQ